MRAQVSAGGRQLKAVLSGLQNTGRLDDGVAKALIKELRDPDCDHRTAIIGLLAKHRVGEATPVLVAVFATAGNQQDALSAIKAISSCDPTQGVKFFSAVTTRLTSYGSRPSLADRLDATATVLTQMIASTDPAQRIFAAKALREMPSDCPKARDALKVARTLRDAAGDIARRPLP